MRIGISGMFWGEPNVGSGQYVRHLVRHLPEVAPQHEYLLFLPAYAGAEIPRLANVAVDRVPTPLDKVHPRLAKLWYEQIELPRAAARLAVDVLHVPYYAPPLRQPVPVVATIHDMIPLILPDYRGPALMRAYTWLATRAVCRSAELVAVSDHTRDDVIDMLRISAQRVHTVYEGVDPRYRQQSRGQIAAALERFSLREPFIYYIGGLDVRKNIPLLLRAFGRVRRRYGKPVQLVIGGKQSGSYSALFPPLEPIILDEGLAGDVAFIGPVTTEENAALYAGAAAFVWPSRYEGFGLPPLEAMASGAAVISSDASSMPEIVGDGGLLIPPHDTEAWATAMLKMLGDEELRGSYRQRGLARAADFDWARFAGQMVAVYERVPPRHQQAARPTSG